jgi:hypothetical protein
MVIDTRLAFESLTQPGKKTEVVSIPEYHDLGKFTCDGVSIRLNNNTRKGTWEPGLRLRAEMAKDGHIDIDATVWMHNPKNNHDKRVTVILAIVDGQHELHSTTIGPFEVEDHGDWGEHKEHRRFSVPADVVLKQPAPTLRITVITTDD